MGGPPFLIKHSGPIGSGMGLGGALGDADDGADLKR
jgi:hypothetical protein